jgi:hypothetical protein
MKKLIVIKKTMQEVFVAGYELPNEFIALNVTKDGEIFILIMVEKSSREVVAN